MGMASGPLRSGTAIDDVIDALERIGVQVVLDTLEQISVADYFDRLGNASSYVTVPLLKLPRRIRDIVDFPWWTQNHWLHHDRALRLAARSTFSRPHRINAAPSLTQRRHQKRRQFLQRLRQV